MRLELATVLSCGPNGCRVMPLGGDAAMETRYSALVQDRVKIRPGQLVALDMEPLIPEVAWRWYRARVVQAGEREVVVQERERQLSAALLPDLETAHGVGDEIWVTGMDGGWELHDTVVDGKPSDPSRLREKIFPRIVQLLTRS